MRNLVTLLTLLALAMAGCAYPVGPRESTGTLIGAGTGALIGSQFGSGEGRIVATALGTLAGALIGQDFGRTLDRTDQLYMQQNAQRSLELSPSYQASGWVNPDTGHSGTITPTRTYQGNTGEYCREYRQTVIVAGNEQQAYGHACRQADGSWRISSAAPAVQGQVVGQRSVTRVVPATSYQPIYRPLYRPVAYYPGYYYPGYSYPNYSYPGYTYPYYGYPGYLWPLTSISFSYGHFSGHRHHFKGLHHGHRHHFKGLHHGHRGQHFGVKGRFGHRGSWRR